MQPERPRLAALVLEVKRRFAERDLPPPNYRTICNRVHSLDLRLATAKREGSKKAREVYGPVEISTLRPFRPLDVLQIDHTPVDVIVVDQQRRLPIGRPWLTLAVDVKTRMIAGFHVSLWSPSTISLALALSQALDKSSPLLSVSNMNLFRLWHLSSIQLSLNSPRTNAAFWRSALVQR